MCEVKVTSIVTVTLQVFPVTPYMGYIKLPAVMPHIIFMHRVYM